MEKSRGPVRKSSKVTLICASLTWRSALTTPFNEAISSVSVASRDAVMLVSASEASVRERGRVLLSCKCESNEGQ